MPLQRAGALKRSGWFYWFSAKAEPDFLFRVEEGTFQVSFHGVGGGFWFAFLDGCEYGAVLLDVGLEEVLGTACCDVEDPALGIGYGDYGGGKEGIVGCPGDNAVEGGIALAELLATFGFGAELIEGDCRTEFAQFMRGDALGGEADGWNLQDEAKFVEANYLRGIDQGGRVLDH